MKLRIRSLVAFVLTISCGASNASAQWQAISLMKFTNVKCMLSVNDSTILVGGDNWTFLRSTDAGTTWSTVVVNGMVPDTILSLGQGGGFIFAGANGVSSLYRSSDNGASWSPSSQGLSPGTAVNSIACVNGTMYAATDAGVYASTNFGGMWQADIAGLRTHTIIVPIPYATTGLTAVGSRVYTIQLQAGGGVYTKLVDSVSWIPIGLDTCWGYALASIDTNVFAGVSKGVFVYSGGGSSWLNRSNGLPSYFSSCILTTVDSLLFASTGNMTNGVFLSSDLGQSWRAVSDSVFINTVVHTLVATKKYLVAGTSHGAWRIPLASLKTSVKDGHSDLPTGYVLNQNVPNPFNPTTAISYELSAVSNVRLCVFDLLGREVAVLVNGRQQAGTYSTTWDASKFASGIYFARLEAGGKVMTKKMCLVK